MPDLMAELGAIPAFMQPPSTPTPTPTHVKGGEKEEASQKGASEEYESAERYMLWVTNGDVDTGLHYDYNGGEHSIPLAHLDAAWRSSFGDNYAHSTHRTRRTWSGRKAGGAMQPVVCLDPQALFTARVAFICYDDC